MARSNYLQLKSCSVSVPAIKPRLDGLGSGLSSIEEMAGASTEDKLFSSIFMPLQYMIGWKLLVSPTDLHDNKWILFEVLRIST